MREVSILIPSYMENDNLPFLVDELQETMKGRSYEVILINDGNSDDSFKTVKDLEKKYKNVHGLFSHGRRGKTQAIKDGLRKSSGRIIVLMDADNQYSPRDITFLLEALRHSDAVNGWRIHRKDSATRKVESKIYNLLLRVFFGVKFRDCNSGLKVFKRKPIETIVDQMRERWHRYLLVLVASNNYRVIEVPINHFNRTVGKSKYPSSPLKLVWGFYDLLSVKIFLTRNSRRRGFF